MRDEPAGGRRARRARVPAVAVSVVAGVVLTGGPMPVSAGEDRRDPVRLAGRVCEGKRHEIGPAEPDTARGDCAFPLAGAEIVLRDAPSGTVLASAESAADGAFALESVRVDLAEICLEVRAMSASTLVSCGARLVSHARLGAGDNAVWITLLTPTYEFEEFAVPEEEPAGATEPPAEPALLWVRGGEPLRAHLQSLVDRFDQHDLEGRRWTRDAFRGRWTLIEFWASWCGFCRKEIPYLAEASRRFGERGFQIVGINVDDQPAATIGRWARAQGMSWPQIAAGAPTGGLAAAFGIDDLPRSVLVDPSGRVAGVDLRGARIAYELARRLR